MKCPIRWHQRYYKPASRIHIHYKLARQIQSNHTIPPLHHTTDLTSRALYPLQKARVLCHDVLNPLQLVHPGLQEPHVLLLRQNLRPQVRHLGKDLAGG